MEGVKRAVPPSVAKGSMRFIWRVRAAGSCMAGMAADGWRAVAGRRSCVGPEAGWRTGHGLITAQSRPARPGQGPSTAIATQTRPVRSPGTAHPVKCPPGRPYAANGPTPGAIGADPGARAAEVGCNRQMDRRTIGALPGNLRLTMDKAGVASIWQEWEIPARARDGERDTRTRRRRSRRRTRFERPIRLRRHRRRPQTEAVSSPVR